MKLTKKEKELTTNRHELARICFIAENADYAEDRRQKTEDRGRKTEDGRRRTEDGRQRTEDGGGKKWIPAYNMRGQEIQNQSATRQTRDKKLKLTNRTNCLAGEVMTITN
jgi:hypothetical protein